MARVFANNKALAGNQLSELIGPGANRMLAVRNIGTVLVIDGFTRDDDAVEKIVEQRRSGLFGRDPDGVFIQCRFTRDGGDVLPLLTERVISSSPDRMDNVVRGHRRTVMKSVVLPQVKNPVFRIPDLPTLNQQSNMLPLIEVVGAETT